MASSHVVACLLICPTTYTGDGYHAWMGVMHCVRGLCYYWLIDWSLDCFALLALFSYFWYGYMFCSVRRIDWLTDGRMRLAGGHVEKREEERVLELREKMSSGWVSSTVLCWDRKPGSQTRIVDVEMNEEETEHTHLLNTFLTFIDSFIPCVCIRSVRVLDPSAIPKSLPAL